MRRITEVLRRQLGLNEENNLLHPGAAHTIEIEPTFLAALEQALGDETLPVTEKHLAEIVSAATASLIDRIYNINQYIQVNRAAKESLEKIYLLTWRKMIETRNVEATLRKHHYPLLADWVSGLYPNLLRTALSSQPEIGRILCHEYSVELQLRLLRLHLQEMKQPVLDVGCGKDALLVTYLRQRNIEAYGLDRCLGKKRPFLKEGDWLEIHMGTNRWGTVISNMAFTNHFVYVQNFDAERIPLYKAKYREILDSLQIGGSFVYAPSVPDLEREVDGERYVIQEWPFTHGYGVTRVTKVAP
jgi:hypothetical protein